MTVEAKHPPRPARCAGINQHVTFKLRVDVADLILLEK